MKYPLSKEMQISILEDILQGWNLDRFGYGICSRLDLRLVGLYTKFSISRFLPSAHIPMFCREEAMRFGAHPTESDWWPLTQDGHEKRKEFIQWMLQTLKLGTYDKYYIN